MPTNAMSSSPLYFVWRNIKDRCLNVNQKDYPDYGGRGITICDRWRNSFLVFNNWAMKNGYEHGLEIDRIDNDRGYEPNNCRFVTRSVNMQNTRKRAGVSSQYRGVSRSCRGRRWHAQIRGADGKVIHIGHYLTEEAAARAYDQVAVELRGSNARPNFPVSKKASHQSVG